MFMFFSKTIISALVAAKVVAIMDAMPFINLYSNSPGYIRVMYKSLIYVGGVFIISLVEDLFHTYRQVNSIQGAISIFIETRHFFPFYGSYNVDFSSFYYSQYFL